MVDVDTPHPFEGPQSSLENAAARFSRGDSSSYSHLWQQVTIRTCPCVFWIFNSMKLFVAWSTQRLPEPSSATFQTPSRTSLRSLLGQIAQLIMTFPLLQIREKSTMVWPPCTLQLPMAMTSLLRSHKTLDNFFSFRQFSQWLTNRVRVLFTTRWLLALGRTSPWELAELFSIRRINRTAARLRIAIMRCRKLWKVKADKNWRRTRFLGHFAAYSLS